MDIDRRSLFKAVPFLGLLEHAESEAIAKDLDTHRGSSLPGWPPELKPSGLTERVPWLFYDTVIFPAGLLREKYHAFAAGVGAIDPERPAWSGPKTKLETNMLAGNAFPAPTAIEKLRFSFGSTMFVRDLVLILEAMYFEFRINHKLYLEGNLDSIRGQDGLYCFEWRFPWCHYVSASEAFSLDLSFPGDLPFLQSRCRLVVSLLGFVERAIQ